MLDKYTILGSDLEYIAKTLSDKIGPCVDAESIKYTLLGIFLNLKKSRTPNMFDIECLELLTDLYQLTMAYGYWKSGKSEQESSFSLFFRRNPFCGNYAICSGLEFAKEYISDFSFCNDSLDYLKSIGLFSNEFLLYLADLKLSLDIDAIPEGTFVFPNEPLMRVKGPLLQCQLVETPLLNVINFNTLIATKASRICCAANYLPVLELGLRRAQGIDGGLSASRAAYIGGCAATSNVLAGKKFGIPVKGTHSHSWVMSFDSELEAFVAYAKAMPENCMFTVDTYGDVIQGTKSAIAASEIVLRPNGYDLKGIRLDSKDLAKDSIISKDMLMERNFTETSVIATNDLDEYKITDIRSKDNKIDAYGVGTSLVTAKDDPALGGVYKLGAIRNKNQILENKIKHTDGKTTLPGILQVTRGEDEDVIHFEHSFMSGKPLLQKVVRNGKVLKPSEDILIIRERVKKEVKDFSHIMGVGNENKYRVEIDSRVLHEQRRLINNIEKE